MPVFPTASGLFRKLLPVLVLGAFLASGLAPASELPDPGAVPSPAGNSVDPARDLYRDPPKPADAGNVSGTPDPETASPVSAPEKPAVLPEASAVTAPAAAPASKDTGSPGLRLSGTAGQDHDYGVSDKNSRGGSSLLEFTMSCFFVIGFIFVLAWLLKKTRLVPNSKNSRLRLISVLPTGPKTKLLLVQAGDDEILVGVTPTSLNMVYKLPGKAAQEEEKKLAEKSAFFRNLLDRNIGDCGSPEDASGEKESPDRNPPSRG